MSKEIHKLSEYQFVFRTMYNTLSFSHFYILVMLNIGFVSITLCLKAMKCKQVYTTRFVCTDPLEYNSRVMKSLRYLIIIR